MVSIGLLILSAVDGVRDVGCSDVNDLFNVIGFGVAVEDAVLMKKRVNPFDNVRAAAKEAAEFGYGLGACPYKKKLSLQGGVVKNIFSIQSGGLGG